MRYELAIPGADPATVARFLAKVEKHDENCECCEGCWLWTGCRHRQGYGRFRYEGRTVNAQRAAYELFVGPIPPGLHVLHACDRPPCVNPAHLSPGTHTENMRDALQRNRLRPGSGENLAKLDRATVGAIRDEYGRLCESLAERYGVTSGHVDRLLGRRHW